MYSRFLPRLFSYTRPQGRSVDGETTKRAKNLEIFVLCVIRKGKTADIWNSEVLLSAVAHVDRSQRMESLSSH